MMNTMQFQSLTLCDDVNLEGYREALDYALQEDKILNIALTGSYGAGKSSVLESYKKQLAQEGKEQHQFFHISLARFDDVEKNDKNQAPDWESENEKLEGKILNQLIQKVDKSAAREVGVGMHTNPSKDDIFAWVGGIGLGLIAILYFATLTWSSNGIFSWDFINVVVDERRNVFLLVTMISILLGCVIYLVSFLVSQQIKYQIFRRICIKDNVLDLFPKDDSGVGSYFDRYLEEICYLFRNAGADVFVFEDLDRYNSNSIFVKLREINSIINHQACPGDRRKGAAEPKKIRFLYLVRDDVFTKNDRTKFFDFIIPIVPVISGQNAYTMFMKYFDDALIQRELPYIKQISLYIDDMRLLNNVYNEYLIYEKKLQKIMVDNSFEKVFSLLIYKNLFPTDYIMLQQDRGFVADVLRVKKELCKEKKTGLMEELDAIKVRYQEVQTQKTETICKNQKEINALLFPIDKDYRINGHGESNYDNHVEFVNALLENPDKVSYVREYYGDTSVSPGTITQLKAKMEASPEYKQYMKRINYMEEEYDKQLDNIRRQKENKEKEIEQIEMLPLAAYAKKYELSEVFDRLQNRYEETAAGHVSNPYKEMLADEKNRRLLSMLFTNGYIDENYSDFVAIFHEGDISGHDMKYVRSILDSDALAPDYPIENPEAVSRYLTTENLQGNHARNLHMFCYYFDRGENSDKAAMLDAINDYEQYDFVTALIHSPYPYKKWVGLLLNRYPNYVAIYEDVSPNESAYLMVAGLFYASERLLESEYTDEEVVTYIESMDAVTAFDDVLHHERVAIEEFDAERIISRAAKILMKMGVKFWEFVPKDSNESDMAYAIYKHYLYHITMPNIGAVLKTYYGIEMKEAVVYDQIRNTGKETTSYLYSYVQDAMDEFVSFRLMEEGEWRDSSVGMTEILNLADKNQIPDILSKMQKQITYIKGIDDIHTANMLIENGKLAYRVENIFDYYDKWADERNEEGESTVENVLLTYLNNFPMNKIHKFNEAANAYKKRYNTEDRISRLFIHVVDDTDMPEDKYITFVVGMNRIWANRVPTHIPDQRLPVLFDNHIVKMSAQGLKDMRQRPKALLQKYILSDVKNYIDIIESEDWFELEEFALLLDQEFADAEINHYIEEKIYEHLNELIDMECHMTKARCSRIIENARRDITMENRLHLLALHVGDYTKEELITLFEEEDWPLPVGMFQGKKPTVEKSEGMKHLLEQLEHHQYIGSFKDVENDETLYRVFSKRV